MRLPLALTLTLATAAAVTTAAAQPPAARGDETSGGEVDGGEVDGGEVDGGEVDGGERAEGEGTDEAPREPEVRPPAIEHLPPVDLPEGVTPENLTARVRIDPDGTGTLLDTDAPEAARAALAAALAEARFRPATIDGTPVAATVRVAFDVADAPDGGGPDATPTDRSAPDDETAADDTTADDTTAGETTAGETTADEPAADEPAAEPVFGATASVQRARATARELELEEMRDLPGALGDPFRVLDSLPGVVAPFSGFPYVYVRGAPPAGTVYFYDGIQVPGLFHLVLGPAVIHPAMVGDIAFHPSVAPARYGRHTGGVFAGQGVDSARAFEGVGGELELRLIDVQGYVRTPVGDDGGSFAFAARYGWPGAVVSLVSQDLRLTYWDYQTRLDLPLGGGDRFQATVFGSFDRATQGPNENDQATLQFHRAELRYLRERAAFDYGVALQLGWEESQFGDVVQIVAARVGPRVWASVRPRSDLSLRVGGEAFAVRGRFSNDPFPDATDDDEPPPDDPPDDDDDDGDPFDQFVDPLRTGARARSLGGAFAELSWRPGAWTVDAGARLDVWLTGGEAEVAGEPRLAVAWQPSEALSLHAAVGMGHQPATLPTPAPGTADLSLDAGLQRAYNAELGAALELEGIARVEATTFYGRYQDIIPVNLFFECDEDDEEDSPGPGICPDQGLPRADADALGLELFVKRSVQERVSGWISYTLAKAWARSRAGTRYTPQFDVRHVFNLVAQYRFAKPEGLEIGGRLLYRAGFVAYATTLQGLELVPYEQRLPGFFRADIRISYAWQKAWGRLRLALEWFNLTAAREPFGLDCETNDLGLVTETPCDVSYGPRIFFPNLGLRATF